MKHAIFLILTTLALAACSQNPPVTNSNSPGEEKAVFQDVPIPPGLSYDAGYGHRTTAGHIRVYEQDLSGKQRPEEVAKFYRNTLPAHGWTLASDEGTKLSFLKKEEQLAIAITPTSDGVKVKVKIGYKQ